MIALARLLMLKIVLTLAIWCVPLLLFPPELLRMLGFPVPEPILFLRLLGVAYVALVVGYAFGWRETRRGSYPSVVVWIGIVSNGGACLLLLIAAIHGAWADWAGIAPVLMWGSLVGTGAISIGLVLLGPFAIGRAPTGGH